MSVDRLTDHSVQKPAIRDALIVVDNAADALADPMAHQPQRHDPAEFLFLPTEVIDDDSAELSLAS